MVAITETLQKREKEVGGFIEEYSDLFDIDPNRKIRGILVAPKLARGAQSLLASLGLEFKSLSPEKCAEILKQKSETPLTNFFE